MIEAGLVAPTIKVEEDEFMRLQEDERSALEQWVQHPPESARFLEVLREYGGPFPEQIYVRPLRPCVTTLLPRER